MWKLGSLSKRYSIAGCLFLLMFTFAVTDLQASGTSGGLLIGGSISQFTGTNDIKNGWGAQLGLSFFVPGWNELVLTFDYHKASVSKRYSSMSYHRGVRQLIFLGNLKGNLANPHRHSIIPYLLLGAGFTDWKSSTDVQGIENFQGGTEEGTDFTYTWGFGLEFSPIKGQKSWSYIQVRSMEGKDSDLLDDRFFLFFTIGMKFLF